jgi:hypothetical protein
MIAAQKRLFSVEQHKFPSGRAHTGPLNPAQMRPDSEDGSGHFLQDKMIRGSELLVDTDQSKIAPIDQDLFTQNKKEDYEIKETSEIHADHLSKTLRGN